MPTALEVRSRKRSREHASLDRFMDRYGDCVGKPIVAHPRDIDVRDDVLYIPIYMVSLL